MELSTERLSLRPWREDDAPDLYACASDPRVGEAADWPPHRNVAESRTAMRDTSPCKRTKPRSAIGSGFPTGAED